MSFDFDFNRRPPSKDQIKGNQDFDKLFKSFQEDSPKGSGRMKWWIIGILLFMVAILLVLDMTDFQSESSYEQVESSERSEEVAAVPETDSLAMKDSQKSNPSEKSIKLQTTAEREEPTKPENTVVKSIQGDLVASTKPVVTKIDTDSDEKESGSTEIKAPEQVYVPARFPFGLDSLYSYITSNMIYPDTTAISEGVVKVRFRVKRDSTIEALGIEEGVREDFDWEAFRLVSEMPNWIPATANDIPVNSEVIIPIRFQRPDIETDSSAYEN